MDMVPLNRQRAVTARRYKEWVREKEIPILRETEDYREASRKNEAEVKETYWLCRGNDESNQLPVGKAGRGDDGRPSESCVARRRNFTCLRVSCDVM